MMLRTASESSPIRRAMAFRLTTRNNSLFWEMHSSFSVERTCSRTNVFPCPLWPNSRIVPFLATMFVVALLVDEDSTPFDRIRLCNASHNFLYSVSRLIGILVLDDDFLNLDDNSHNMSSICFFLSMMFWLSVILVRFGALSACVNVICVDGAMSLTIC